MKIQNTEMEFIIFDARDVIATSTIPGSNPLAYASGGALTLGEYWYGLSDGAGENAVDALDYNGFVDISNAIDYELYYEITEVGKSGDGKGYGIRFDTTTSYEEKSVPGDSIGGIFDGHMSLREWIVSYMQ